MARIIWSIIVVLGIAFGFLVDTNELSCRFWGFAVLPPWNCATELPSAAPALSPPYSEDTASGRSGPDNGSAPPEKQLWAAIAYLPRGTFAAVNRRSSRIAAENAAKMKCTEIARGISCKVRSVSGPWCMALAFSYIGGQPHAAAVSRGRSIEQASGRSKGVCDRHRPSQAECLTAYAVCPDGRRRKYIRPPLLWAALAYTTYGGFSAVWRKRSRSAAEQAAMGRCRAKAARGSCRVKVVSGAFCIAFVSPRVRGRYRGAAIAKSISISKSARRAMTTCERRRPSMARCIRRISICADGRKQTY